MREHPTRIEVPKRLDPPEEDYTCPGCGVKMEVAFDSSYSCPKMKDWHCVDCHNSHPE